MRLGNACPMRIQAPLAWGFGTCSSLANANASWQPPNFSVVPVTVRCSALQCVAVHGAMMRCAWVTTPWLHMQAGQLHHCHKWRDTHPAELPPKTFRDEATRMRKCQAGPLFLSAPSHHVQSGTPSLRTSQALSA